MPEPFEYVVTKDGRLRVFRGGKLVTTVSAAKAARYVDVLGDDDEQDQAILQRLTGNYRHGNERRSR